MADVDSELARIQAEIDARTKQRVEPLSVPPAGRPPEETRRDRLADTSRNVGRKAIAAVVLLVVVAIIARVLIGFVVGILWIVAAVALLIAALWAYRELRR